MAMNNVAILYFCYNYIYKNKQGGSLIGYMYLIPTPSHITDPYNNSDINNYSIIISNQNSRYT